MYMCLVKLDFFEASQKLVSICILSSFNSNILQKQTFPKRKLNITFFLSDTHRHWNNKETLKNIKIFILHLMVNWNKFAINILASAKVQFCCTFYYSAYAIVKVLFYLLFRFYAVWNSVIIASEFAFSIVNFHLKRLAIKNIKDLSHNSQNSSVFNSIQLK